MNKDVRMQILLDRNTREMVSKGAHHSWMSMGNYIRDVVALFEGESFDTANDWVTAGKEIGLEGFEALVGAAGRRGISVRDFCLGFATGIPNSARQEPENPTDSSQISLFE